MRRLSLVVVACVLVGIFLRPSAGPVEVPLVDDAALVGVHNPLTGHGFTSAQVERIERLREALPDNALVPTTDPLVLARRAEVAAAQERRESRIVAGMATPDEVHVFYGTQRALVEDRLALVELVLDEPGWDPRIYEKYERVRDFAHGQIARIEEREQASLSLLSR